MEEIGLVQDWIPVYTGMTFLVEWGDIGASQTTSDIRLLIIDFKKLGIIIKGFLQNCRQCKAEVTLEQVRRWYGEGMEKRSLES